MSCLERCQYRRGSTVLLFIFKSEATIIIANKLYVPVCSFYAGASFLHFSSSGRYNGPTRPP